MTRWVITYNKDNNTSTLEIESPNKPSMEQAVRHTLKMARQRYEEQEPSEVDEDLRGPAVLLAERFGITITGITQRDPPTGSCPCGSRPDAGAATDEESCMFGLDALELARIQFAFTVSFHILFPAITIGLASYLTVLEALC